MVSIVLPVYKADFLAQAIESILGQTYKNFDLTIVNDCSPYNIDEIVSKYVSDNRVKYVKLEKNRGGVNLVAHWNECMRYATRELALLASDDDYYEPDYLMEMVKLSLKYPSVNLFHCRIRHVDEMGRTLLVSQSALEYESSVDFISQRLIYRRKQSLQEFMFRRKAYVDIGGFVEFPMAWYTDDATWDLLSRNGVAYSGKVLFNFRMSGQNISTPTHNVVEKIEAIKQFTRWMCVFLASLNPESVDDRFVKSTIDKKYYDILKSDYLNTIQGLSLKNQIKVLRRAYKEKEVGLKTSIHILLLKLFK